MKEIITSLDVGSDTIKLVVGEIFKDELIVLACSEIKSKGIKKGIVIEPEEAAKKIKESFDKISDIIGVTIDNVILTVPSYNAEFIETSGYTTITRENKVINGDDITRALQACVYNKVPVNQELISIMPIEYIVEEEKVNDPKGKEGTRLTINSILALAPKKNVYGLLSVLESLNIKVSDICFGGLADYYEFKTKEFENKLGAIVNIGEYKTEVSIIKKNTLIATETLDLGGRNVNRDISYMYDITLSDSKRLKEKFALAHKKHANTSETEDVLTKNDVSIKINQYEISEIVYSRVKEILELSKKQINLLTKEEISYIIITGGCTEIADFQEVVDEIYGKNACFAKIKEMGVRNNKFSSSLGNIKYYREKLEFRDKHASTISEEKQSEMFVYKRKVNENSLLGKVYGYFFE